MLLNSYVWKSNTEELRFTGLQFIVPTSDGSGMEKVGFGYTRILKSRVRAGNEISGIGYFRVKTQYFASFHN